MAENNVQAMVQTLRSSCDDNKKQLDTEVEEHVHRVREGGFVREPGDEQRPRLGRALVTSARVARVFGAHKNGTAGCVSRAICTAADDDLVEKAQKVLRSHRCSLGRGSYLVWPSDEPTCERRKKPGWAL